MIHDPVEVFCAGVLVGAGIVACLVLAFIILTRENDKF
jgi:hypothetical protein